jgi:hypothetical protein
VRVRIGRQVAVMFDLDPACVQVRADPVCQYGGVSGHLVVVDDPDDPHTVLRLVPENGDEILFLLLGPCPHCGGEVPSLRSLASPTSVCTWSAGGALADPEHDRPNPVPAEVDLDPGHRDDCGATPPRAAHPHRLIRPEGDHVHRTCGMPSRGRVLQP